MTLRITLLALLCSVGASAAEPGLEEWTEGIAHYVSEDYRQAIESFEQAVIQNPRNSRFHVWLGRAVGRRAERMTGVRRLGAYPLGRRAKQLFDRALELDATDVEALKSLFQFHMRAPGMIGGDRAEAERLARRIAELEPAEGAIALAAYYERTGDMERAEEQYSSSSGLFPDHAGIAVAHAAFLARQGDRAESDALLEKALARHPDIPEVWLGVAKTWIRSKRRELYPRARQLLGRYLESEDRHPDSDPPTDVRKLLKGL